MKSTATYPLLTQNTYQESTSIKAVSNLLVALVLLLLPYERLQLPFNTKIVDFALIITVLFSGFCFVFVHKYIHLPLIWPIWMIFLASVVSTMTGLMSSGSFIGVMKIGYIFIWFIALTNALINQPPGDLNKLMKIWCLIALLEAATSILGMLGIGPEMFYTPPTSDVALSVGSFNRAIGSYLNSNALATYLTVSLFVLLATNWSKSIRLFLGIWIMAGIFGTGSMSAISSTFISILFLFGLNSLFKQKRIPKSWGKIFLSWLTVFFVIALILGTSSALIKESELFMITIGRVPRSFSSRIYLILQAWPTFSRYPLGTGPETYHIITGELHNDYIAYLFERGPLGLLGWLGVVATVLFTSLRTAFLQINDHHRWQMLSFGMGFLACTMISLSHELSHFRQMWVFIAFLFAISSHLSKQRETIRYADIQETLSHNATSSFS